MLACDREARQVAERLGPLAKALELAQAVREPLRRTRARSFDTERTHQGARLVLLRVEHVVGRLEREADRDAEAAQARDVVCARPADASAARARGREERRGLALVDALDLRELVRTPQGFALRPLTVEGED